ncbi:hypothetical protein [Neisseria meningitidis]|uniref:hypothetical protein n=1 Tax=Neisseria meningitidis TaxID=487 RepID=UPI000318F4A0|nr:hypothetical protein [Neisseria meningitidis]
MNDLSKEELASIQDTNGKVITVSNPGIFNNREDSLSNAAKQNRNSTNGSGVIAVMNLQQGNINLILITNKRFFMAQFKSCF